MLINKEKTLATAASKAGMDAKTARKYIKVGQLPSQVKQEHTWQNIFITVWLRLGRVGGWYNFGLIFVSFPLN